MQHVPSVLTTTGFPGGPIREATPDPETDERPSIALPLLPTPAPPFSFPVVATIAPVLASGVLWVVTQSPSVLVFALLGPVIAIASFADSKLHGRRRRKQETRRFQKEAASVRAAIETVHATEREARDEAFPGIERILQIADADHDRWSLGVTSPAWVVAGRGEARSRLVVTGGAEHGVLGAGSRTPAATLGSLRAEAVRLTDAAVVIDARAGIGVAGPRIPAMAIARACVLQVARITSPVDWIVRAGRFADWAWLGELPHSVREVELGEGRIEFVGPSADARASPVLRVVVAARLEELPRHCRAVLLIGSDGAVRLIDRDRTGRPRALRPEFASADDATLYAITARRCAEREGMIPNDVRSLPGTVAFASLPLQPGSGRAGNDSLRCAIASTTAGPWHVDLVAEGPHAVIGGTTGSGKSELLLTWVLAMASVYSPQQVNFLLVDFKGGASFANVRSLPHSVGVVTDLDPAAAQRALDSLRAELAFRERALAEKNARSIEALADGALARLVIVVDEFAALANDFPDLHSVFTDLAARGRSLGIHLILCTQRPSASFRDSVLANCGLRISLRLNDRADSVVLLGTGDATALPRSPGGRAIAAAGEGPPTTVQVGLATARDAADVIRRWSGAPAVRRPWCEPLPSHIPHAALPEKASGTGGFAFGITDIPSEQRQETARYDPLRHGNLIIHGARASGKTTAIAAILASVEAAGGMRVRIVPGSPGGAWDAIADVHARIAASRGHPAAEGGAGSRTAGVRRILAVDDVDAIVSRLGNDHRLEFVERLARILRDGPGSGTTVVLSAQQVPSMLSGVVTACDSRLVMRMPSRQEHLLVGGDGAQFDSVAVPGRARWQGHLVQVGYLPSALSAPQERPTPVVLAPGGTTVLVSRSPEAAAARLLAGHAERRRREGRSEQGRDGSAEGQKHVSAQEQGAGSRHSQKDGLSTTVRVVPLAANTGRAPELTVGDTTEHTVMVGDPDAWQSAWVQLSGLRRTASMVFDGCTIADYRALSGSRELPPPLDGSPGSVWLLAADGGLRRATLR